MWIALLVLLIALGALGIIFRAGASRKGADGNLADDFDIIEGS